MARKEPVVRYTAEELTAKRARGESRTDWARVKVKTEAELAANTAADPAWKDIPDDWYKDAKPGLPFRHRARTSGR